MQTRSRQEILIGQVLQELGFEHIPDLQTLQAKADQLHKNIVDVIKEQYHQTAVALTDDKKFDQARLLNRSYHFLIQCIHELNVANPEYWIAWKDNLFNNFSNQNTANFSSLNSSRANLSNSCSSSTSSSPASSSPSILNRDHRHVFGNLLDCFLSDVNINIYDQNFSDQHSVPIYFRNFQKNKSAVFHFDLENEPSTVSFSVIYAAFIHVMLDMTNSQFLVTKQEGRENPMPDVSGDVGVSSSENPDVFLVAYTNPFNQQLCVLYIDKTKKHFQELKRLQRKLDFSWIYYPDGKRQRQAIHQEIDLDLPSVLVDDLRAWKYAGDLDFLNKNSLECLVNIAASLLPVKIPELYFYKMIDSLHDGLMPGCRGLKCLTPESLSLMLNEFKIENQIHLLGSAFEYILKNRLMKYTYEKSSGFEGLFAKSGWEIAISHVRILRDKLEDIIIKNKKIFASFQTDLDIPNVQNLIDFNWKTGAKKAHGQTDLRILVEDYKKTAEQLHSAVVRAVVAKKSYTKN